MSNWKMAERLFDELRPNASYSLSKLLNESSQGELGVLGYLFFEKNNVLAGQLSDALNVSTARIANILNSLERKGFIKREEDALDKRKTIVVLTDNGKDFACNMRKKIINDISNIISEVGQEDIKEYIRISGKMKEVITKL